MISNISAGRTDFQNRIDSIKQDLSRSSNFELEWAGMGRRKTALGLVDKSKGPGRNTFIIFL
jgi:hypothetical protein